MLPLFRNLFWLALFVVLTFAFVVLFEHGMSDYPTNVKAEWQKLVAFTADLKPKPAAKGAEPSK